MAEELQSLLEKINIEGVKKAEAQAAGIVAQAEARAADIVAKANADAEKCAAEAAQKADALAKRAAAATAQAVRDASLALREELKNRLERALQANIEKAMTPEFMAGVIRELAAAFVRNTGAPVEILASVKDVESLKSALAGALAGDLKARPEIFADANLSGGMQVGFGKDGEAFFDFSEQAISELILGGIGPGLAAVAASAKAEE